MKFKTFLLIGITVGLVAGLVQYKQTLKTASSANEPSGFTSVYIDSQSCHVGPGARWEEWGYEDNRRRPGPYPFPWRVYKRFDRLEPIYREPPAVEKSGTYSLLTLNTTGENPKDIVTKPTAYLPTTTEIVTHCGNEISILYVYRCLGIYCAPPQGKGFSTDDYRDYGAMMEDLVLIEKYLRADSEGRQLRDRQDASWAQTPGKYLITPWCDPEYFDCSQ